MNDEDVVEIVESASTPDAPVPTMAELTAKLEAMHDAKYGFGFEFADGKQVFYTGKAGRGFMAPTMEDTFTKFSKEGAMRKSLELYTRYSAGLLVGAEKVLIVNE